MSDPVTDSEVNEWTQWLMSETLLLTVLMSDLVTVVNEWPCYWQWTQW